jgi:cellulose synthase (UDP-forming)
MAKNTHDLVSASCSNAQLGGSNISAYSREIRLTWLCLAFTLVAWVAVTWETWGILWQWKEAGNLWGVFEQAIFILIVQGMLYGNFVYQLTRLGYLYRRFAHQPAPAEAREAVYDGDAPALVILVPSYKEELAVVQRTLLSAALQDYPNRRVILLLDDPPDSKDSKDQQALAAARRLPQQLQETFDAAAAPFLAAQREFQARQDEGGVDLADETARLAWLYQHAADRVDTLAAAYPAFDHAGRLLHDRVFARASAAHRERAQSLSQDDSLKIPRLEREYRRLAQLFQVELDSFERKRYVNLSHESSKAMNLNSYIGLLGRSWRVVVRLDGPHLQEGPGGTLTFPAADFLLTLDADSLVVPEYASTLLHEMLRQGNERLAVAQTPYNAFPGCSGLLERLAGATTDIQYIIHQGFTRYGATFWVGANALLRMAALADIRQERDERGFKVPVFIQDRTVIEDTESSVDLVARGWRLFNYPERMAFSATPPDFGSLLIQRRRWANGGLIILPKLLRHLSGGELVAGFFQVHYLISVTLVNLGFLILLSHTFGSSMENAWLPLTALPYFILYARDLSQSGYAASDLWRIYALNLLLLPVNLGGVLKSLKQALTGQRIPFGRTPKVSGRTAAPSLYVVAEYALLVACLILAVMDGQQGHWNAAAFHLGNGLLLVYAIAAFIGLRTSWEDICGSLPRLAKAETLPTQVSAQLAPVEPRVAAIPILTPVDVRGNGTDTAESQDGLP